MSPTIPDDHAKADTPAPGLVIDTFAPLAAGGALRGFADLTLPSGLRLFRCGIFAKGERAWAAPPAKQVIGRDGQVQRGSDGKTRYEATVGFRDRATQDRWSAAVIAALRVAHPEALA